MKIMDRNGRLFGKISIVDVVVILVVLVMGAAIYYKTHQPQTGTKVTTTKIVYEMQLQNQPQYVVDAIKAGDQMYDKDRSTGGSLGEILDIQVTPGTKQAELDDGTVAMVPCEGYYDVLLTLQAEALIESDGNYAVNRIYDLGVNSTRNFNTKYASFVGTIASIELAGEDGV